MVVNDGDDAIDPHIGTTPDISPLVTVIIEEMLDGDRPFYATPLTTLVFHMDRHGSGPSAEIPGFIQQTIKPYQSIAWWR